MRLLEFPCGRRTAPLEEATPATTPRATAEAEEVRPAVADAAGCSTTETRSRRALRRMPSSSWRPSLLSISEDGPPVATPPQQAAMVKGKAKLKQKPKPKPKPNPKSAGRVVPRAGKNDYQHYGVVPTFAPTGFFF